MGVGVQGSLLSAIPKIMLFGTPPITDTGRLFSTSSTKPVELNIDTLAVTNTAGANATYGIQRFEASKTTLYAQERNSSNGNNHITSYDPDTLVATAISDALPVTGWSNGLAVTSSGRIFTFVDGTSDKLYEIDSDTLLPVNNVTSTLLVYDLASCGEELIGTKESTRIYTIDPDTLLSTGYTVISGYTVGSSSRLGGGKDVYYVNVGSTLNTIDKTTYVLIETRTLPSTSYVGVSELI